MTRNPGFYHFPLWHVIVALISIGSLAPFCSVYGQTKLINPGYSNNYVDSYVLPDGTVRIIGSEWGRNRELFYVDKLTDGSITEPVFFPESIGDIDFNFAGIDCKVFPLKSGDVLLGINQGDCDYAPYSSIARFTIDGDVLWAVSMEHFFFNFFVEKLILIDSNIICLISDGLDTLYFDLDGNEVDNMLHYQVYDTIIPTQVGYYASLGEFLFHLNEGFDVLDAVELDDDILSISLSGDSLIIVATTSSIIILDDHLDVAVHSAVFTNYSLVTSSAQWVWIAQKNGDIIQLDYQLQPQDTFQVPKDFQLKSIVAIDEIITLGGNYLGVATTSVFFHTTEADQFIFKINKDIALAGVSLDNPVFYDFESSGHPWAFNIAYKNVVVTVSNTGQDTIQSLTILYGAGSGCSFFCTGVSYGWEFDHLNIYPGIQMELALGNLSVYCVTGSPSSFCLSILPADSLPEIDRLNNRLCVDVNAFLSGVTEAEPSVWKLSPNPANDFITISFENDHHADCHGIILNGRGDLVEKFNLPELTTNIELVDYIPGIYFLSIINNRGVYGFKKFIVIH